MCYYHVRNVADSIIQIAPDGAGKKLDTEQLTIGANTVQRERHQLTGASAAEIAAIKNTDPSSTAYALATRQIHTTDPQVSSATDAAVAAGGQATLDSTQISSGKTGKLLRVVVSASVPFKAIFQTVLNGVATSRVTYFTGPGERAWPFIPFSRDMYTVAEDVTAGFDGFRAVVTNLDTSQAADLYASFEWDEV